MADSKQESPRDQQAGGNLSGHDPTAAVHMVPDFMGQSGQPNNQSTDRAKGSA